MSYLLETLGRGLLGRLLNAFEIHLGLSPGDDVDTLVERRRDAATSFDLAIRLGAAYLREDRVSEARATFEQARGLDGPRQLADIGLACVYDELGRLDAACTHLQRALEAAPTDSAITFGVGLCLEKQDRPDEAAELYERSLDLCSELRNAHERLAAIAVRRGDWRGAQSRYARLAELEPGDLDALLPLANLRLQCGDVDEAIDLFQRTLLVEPDTADDAADVIADIETESELDDAIAIVAGLVDKYPGVSEFRVQLADLYVKADEDEQAVAQYRAALDLHPTFLEATVKLGTQHLRRRRYDNAAQAYTQAVELNDRLLTAFAGLGVAQDVAGREAESQATFDLAVSLAPNSTLLFSESNQLHLRAVRRNNGGGVALYEPLVEDAPRDELLREAIRRHQRVLVDYPLRADLQYRLGMLLRQIDDLHNAADAFGRATEIDPAFAKAWVKLGVLSRELARPEKSLDAFCAALRVDETQIETHYQVGLLYAQYNRFQAAVDRHQAGLAGREGGAEFRSNLSLTLQNVGMLDRADEAWRSTCELAHEANAVLGCNRISDAPPQPI